MFNICFICSICVRFLIWEDVARRPPSYLDYSCSSTIENIGQNHWEHQVKPLRTSGETIENIGWNHWEHWAKPLKKSPETLQKVISHRPFSMFITVDINTSIDRSPCLQRSVWDDFLKGFRRRSQRFQATNRLSFSYVLPQNKILKHWFTAR